MAQQLTAEQKAAIDNYSKDITTLKDTVTAIRKLPGMYTNGVGNNGFLSLIREIFQNAIDQVIDPTSPADRITIYYNEQTLETIVTDNGKGFPFNDMVRMMTAQHTSKNYNRKPYEYPTGIHGSGTKVVNALSDFCKVQSYKYDGSAMELDLKDGYVEKGPYSIPNKQKLQGSIVSFIPCTDILGNLTVEWETVYGLVKDISSLTKIGTVVDFTGVDKEGIEHKEHIVNKDGIITKIIATAEKPICNPIHILKDNGQFKLECAFTFDMGNDDDIPSESIVGYANMSPTVKGEHIDGTLDGLTRWFTQYMNNIYLANQKGKIRVIPNDIKNGLNLIISGFCLYPVMVGQNKSILSVPEMAPFCKTAVMEGLDEWAKTGSNDLAKLCAFFKEVADVRMKSEAGKTKIAQKFSATPTDKLPRKYKKPLTKEHTELIIVEGDSALGTVEQGRDPKCQGLFPIRGKIINAFANSKDKVFANEEVQGINQIILGRDYFRNFTLDDVRIEKVIIMADADVDGSHIAALLLRLFMMYYPQIIKAGMLYKAIPPLYSIKEGKKNRYFTEQIDMVKFVQKTFLANNTLAKLNKTALTDKELTKLFITNADYTYYLEKAANTYAVQPHLLEMVLLHYISNKNSINEKKLDKEINSVYRFMNATKVGGTIIIKGTIDKSNFIPFGDKLLYDCRFVLDILNKNECTHYIMNGKKASLYEIMKIYDNSMPKSVQRYKGLGEMDADELAESTLYPGSDRTLVRYTMESAKEAIEYVRSFESDSKKILKYTGTITREDLLD